MRVLVTDITSYKAIVVARSLSELPEVEIVSCDSRASAKLVRSKYAGRFHVVPSAKAAPQAFVDALEKLCADEHVDTIIPINSDEIRLLLKHKTRFGRCLRGFGSHEAFHRLDNKSAFQMLAESLGLRIPRRYSNIEDAQYPCVIKKVESASSKGVYIVHTYDEAKACIAKHFSDSTPLLQEHIPGFGCGLSALAVDGRITAYSGHRRIAEYPIRGGSSTIRATFFHPDMLKVAQSAISATGWSGLAMFEFKCTPANEVVLIECNPRVWGSIYQSICAGVDFPKLLVGGTVPPRINQETCAFTYLSPLHWASLLGYAMHGDFSALREFWRQRKKLRADVPLGSDPAGYLSVMLRAFG